MPTHLSRRIYEKQICSKVFWFTLKVEQMWSEGHGVDSSRNKVEANNVCAQDPSNTQSADALVAGSLRVWQPYGDKDKRQEMVNKVRTNSSPTRNSERGVTTKRNQHRVDGQPEIYTSDEAAESKTNVNCCVKRQSRQTKDGSSNNTTNSEG